jgi:RNase P subunit RPR2
MNARVSHLFGLGMAYVSENPELSRFYMVKGFEVAEKFGIEVPEDVRCRVCSRCKCIQIPNKNCKVRIRARSSRSPINRKRKKKKKKSSSGEVVPLLRNEIVSVCAMCKSETSLHNNKKTKQKNVATKRKREVEKKKQLSRGNGKNTNKKKRQEKATPKNSSSLLNFLQNFKT